MQNYRIVFVLLAIGAALGVSRASAAPQPVLNIGRLVAASDVIAVGTVVRVSETGPSVVSTAAGVINAVGRLATIRPDRIIKGPRGLSSIDVAYDHPNVFIGYGDLDEGTYRVVFLKRMGDRFTLTSTYYPSLVSAEGGLVSSADPLTAVLQAVAATIHSDAPVTAKREAIYQLLDEKNADVIETLRSVLNDGNEELRLTGAAALLKINDLSGLSVAEAALLNATVNDDTEVLHNLRAGIAQGINDESALPSMVRLLSAVDPMTRRAASSALRRMRSPRAISPLLQALDDVDIQVKHTAVMGLAELTGQREWGPNMMEFSMDQRRYLDHWKNAFQP